MKKADLLRYLEARFAFEPLPHYPMIAVALCGEDEALPPFVRGFLAHIAHGFLDEEEGKERGIFPRFSFNQAKPSEQWNRAEDCLLFLTDERAALEAQQERLEIVEMVEAAQATGKSLETIFHELAEWYGITESAAKHRYLKIVAPREHMSGSIPVALQPDGEIIFRSVKPRT